MKPDAKPTPSPAPEKAAPKPKDWWKKLIGRAKNDDLSQEAYRLGAEWRARMNREGR